MVLHTTVDASRRSGQEAPCRRTPSKLSEDEQWVLEQSGWVNFEWDVEPEDEKAMAEGRLPSGAYMPPKLLVESAPPLKEDLQPSSDGIDFDSLFGDYEGDSEENNTTNLFEFNADELPVLGQDVLDLLEQRLHQDLEVPSQPESHYTPSNSISGRVLVPTPSSAVTPISHIPQGPDPSSSSLTSPSAQRSHTLSCDSSPGPSSIRRGRDPSITPKKKRRVHNSQTYFLTPDLSPSGSSVCSDGETGLEHGIGSSPDFRTPSIPILRLPQCSPTPVMLPNFYYADFSSPLGNGYADMTVSSTQTFHPALVQQSVAGPSSLGSMMPTSHSPSPQFNLVDFDSAFLGFDLNTSMLGIPVKQQSKLGPDRKAKPTLRSASANPYSRKNDSTARRQKRNAQARSNILDDVFKVDDSPELKCHMCDYVQRRGGGDVRSFKRHLETHPENKSVEWRCRGLRGVDGKYRGGCGKTFARKDALQRHVKTAKGVCFSDCIPLFINSSKKTDVSPSLLQSPTHTPFVAPMMRPSSAPIMYWPQDVFQI